MKKTLRSLATTLLLFFLFSQNMVGQVQTGGTPSFQCASEAIINARPEMMERQATLEKELLKTPLTEKAVTPPYTLPRRRPHYP